MIVIGVVTILSLGLAIWQGINANEYLTAYLASGSTLDFNVSESYAGNARIFVGATLLGVLLLVVSGVVRWIFKGKE